MTQVLSTTYSERAQVVLLGLDSMQGLQAARILNARGIPVVGIVFDPTHHARRTNVCERVILVGDGDSQVLMLLMSLAAENGKQAVLVPCTDQTVLFASRFRQELTPNYLVAQPSASTVEMLSDKAKFHAFAEANGFPVPRTYIVASRGEAIAASSRLTYPAILKPSRRTKAWSNRTKLKAFQVADATHLLNLYDLYGSLAESLIVQDWVEGSDAQLLSCNCYFNIHSEPLVSFVSRKIRQWPPRTGQTSLGVEVRDDAVEDLTMRLFQAAGHHGLAYLEVKRDDRTGAYFILEPNVVRPTGRSAIVEAGGVELLLTMYCDLLGFPLPAERTQRYLGARWIHVRRDLQSALFYWRHGELSPGQWLRSLRGKKTYAVLSRRDPLPFLFDIWRTVRNAASRSERHKRTLVEQ